jgi:hypothetical protein
MKILAKRLKFFYDPEIEESENQKIEESENRRIRESEFPRIRESENQRIRIKSGEITFFKISGKLPSSLGDLEKTILSNII